MTHLYVKLTGIKNRKRGVGGHVVISLSSLRFFQSVKNISINLSFCDPEFSQEFPPSALSLEDKWKVSTHTQARTQT